MAKLNAAAALEAALKHHQAGRSAEAQEIYLAILADDPQCAPALHMFGLLAHQNGQHERAIELIGRSLYFDPTSAEACAHLGLAFLASGQTDRAVQCFRKSLGMQKSADSLSYLGGALRSQGKLEEAAAALHEAIGLAPQHSGALNNLANVLMAQGRHDEAIDCYRRVLAARPDHAQARTNLANALKERGIDQMKRGEKDASLASFSEAVELRPDDAAGRFNLGCALQAVGRLDEAVAAYESALSSGPAFAAAANNLGSALKDAGRLDEAIVAFDRALALTPDYRAAHDNLIYTLLFMPQEQCRYEAELEKFNRRFIQPLAGEIEPHGNDRTPNRRLRIGYVSPDLRDHVIGRNILPILTRHNRQQFEIFCYSDASQPDGITARFRAAADAWRDTALLDDAELAKTIRKDRIDILVDLSLHMAGNRLTVFARKPSPLQMSWAGYPGKTGVDTIDYHITDPYLERPTETSFDRPLFLPHSFWCYDQLDVEFSPGPLPALANGFVTFGCLNNFCKVNAQTLRAWAEVLEQTKYARLLLLAPEGSARQRVSQALPAGRVRFVTAQPRLDYFRLYQQIDLVLDTFPYNGHTTSLDALWMGVPVVTQYGSATVSRAGHSQLRNVGLGELVAGDADEFVRKATALAADLPRLAELRATLRDRMQKSPLMDARAFTADLESAYLRSWRQWCERRPA
jgi:predicted O-linked N-acetylglucosamine transferase (SPINDLY family)